MRYSYDFRDYACVAAESRPMLAVTVRGICRVYVRTVDERSNSPFEYALKPEAPCMNVVGYRTAYEEQHNYF